MSKTVTNVASQGERPETSRILSGDVDTTSMVATAFSIDDRQTGHEATGDLVEHEQTYERFLSILVIAVQHIVSCVIGLAIGGLEGQWWIALTFIALATAAALVGAANKSIGPKPGTAILAFEILASLIFK